MTPDPTNPIYREESAARAYLEAMRWPQGPVCPHCASIDRATRLQGASTRAGLWKCRECQKPFSVTIGTLFERSKIPLTKWLLAVALLESNAGVSRLQLQRTLGVTYKTAWLMAERIDSAMPAPSFSLGPPQNFAVETVAAANVADTQPSVRILDAAERLFAERGYFGVSLREVAAEAETLIGVAHYYFGSKSNLFRRVIRRRADEIDAARLQALEALPISCTPRDIAQAYVKPLAERVRDSDASWQRYALLDMRVQNSAILEAEHSPLSDHVATRLAQELRRAVPGLSEADAWWSTLFIECATAFGFAPTGALEQVSQGELHEFAAHQYEDTVVSFLTGGVEALSRAEPADFEVSASEQQQPTVEWTPSGRTRLIDAAEDLFALEGPAGVSLRRIASQASMAPSHSHYYFDSKQELFHAFVTRRADILNADRRHLLDAAESSQLTSQQLARAVLDVLIRPMPARSMREGLGWRKFFRAISPSFAMQGWPVEEIFHAHHEMLRRVVRLLHLAYPDSDVATLYRLIIILTGVTLHLSAQIERIDRQSHGLCRSSNLARSFGRATAFINAGFESAVRDQRAGSRR